MTFPKHALIQIGGNLLGSQGPSEHWSCGVRVTTGDPHGDYLTDCQDYANRLGPQIVSWFKGPGVAASTAQLTTVKVNNIGPDGKYVDATTHQYAVPASTYGAAAPNAPSFCSVAVTWETGLSRGHAARGRMYLPNYIFSSTGAFVDSTAVGQVIAAGKGLLSAIINTNDKAGYQPHPAVVSNIGAGAINLITGVSADNVYDYQSRRKNRLTSTRTTQAWP